MLTSVDAPSNSTQSRLQAAQAKLLQSDMPQLLRITAFLRLSCLALQEPGAYSKLMQQLCRFPDWWTTCTITPLGTLQSSHPAIHHLLEPILSLHYPQPLLLAA